MDEARICATFKNTHHADVNFDTTNDVIEEDTEQPMNDTKYTDGTTGNNVPKDGERKMFIQLETPQDSSINEQQQFRVTIIAYPSSAF